jgi:hypothetical protein
MNNETKNKILVGVIIVAALGILFTLNLSRTKLGYSGYNELTDGFTTATYTVSAIRTQGAVNKILNANYGCAYRRLQNLSNYPIYCVLDNSTSSLEKNFGLMLNASGTHESIYTMDPNNLYCGEINCIATASATISVIER